MGIEGEIGRKKEELSTGGCIVAQQWCRAVASSFRVQLDPATEK